ncbi:MAG TPA: hydantoinase/oxoprolinase family protein [Candidatus Dormibacteraeota bacterium]|jgi:N-methylhydantoinase A|nr:hydantoinase/oxoprolinase family protein [Candidatus Dormibacteraeota bacterium]
MTAREGGERPGAGPVQVAFDVGGTFTDFVLQDADGRLHTLKRLTTYPDPARACLEGLDELVARAGVPWPDLARAVHGTTLGSNLVVERKATGVALVTTRGFRDVLAIGRQKRYQLYDLQIEKPEPLIARDRIWEVTERVLADGSVRTPLDEADARRVIAELQRHQVRSVAVVFLHSYVNPDHERRFGRLVQELAPEIEVSLSCEVSPQFREYERTSTTVVNAYLMQAVRDYLERIAGHLAGRGYRGRLFVMQSGGGVATAEAMARLPVRMIESGPAAGALVAARYGQLVGCPDLIAFDMGGTTAKLSLIVDGEPQMVDTFELHRIRLAPGSGIPMNVRSLDLVEIGAGGGSIARPQLGTIQVGPDSAGSQPGPVCYGRGGTEPTVTDANLVLGYLNPENFAGGSLRLDLEAARRAIAEKVARPLGLSPEEAAWGIHAMVNLNMELATRVVSIERGFDPRRLALVATGGSGPVHGCRLVQALGIDTAILPAASGVASAIGLLVAEIKFDVSRTFLGRLDALEPATVEALFAEMAEEAAAVIRDSTGREPVRLEREVDLRYVGQGYELTVPFASLETVRATFEEVYARRYGMASPDEPVEATTWRLTAFGRRAPVELPAFEPGPAPRPTYRRAYFPEHEGWTDTAVYRRERLTAGIELCGPAIVEERESTTVLPPGFSATVDRLGNLIARRLEGRGR